MPRRRATVSQKGMGAEDVAVLPRLLQCSLCVAVVGILLLSLSIHLHLSSIKLLRRADLRHRTLISKMTKSKHAGGIWQLGTVKRSLVGAEGTEISQKQCQHRQKTDWRYFVGESMKGEYTVTVDFTASQGHMISAATCTSNPGTVKSLKQLGEGEKPKYQCTCKADFDQINEAHLGYDKLTCTTHYWECPVQYEDI